MSPAHNFVQKLLPVLNLSGFLLMGVSKDVLRELCYLPQIPRPLQGSGVYTRGFD